MPTSVRLDPRTEALLRRLARRTGQTRSHIIRDAIARLAESEPVHTPGPYAMVADLVGIAKGGPPDLARRHKEAFRELLTARSRRR